MQNLIKFTQTLLAGGVLSVAIAVDAPTAKAFSLIQKDLFFERNIPGGEQVSEGGFQDFVDDVITPSFPDGLTIFDADGQFRNSTGDIIEEQSKVVRLLFEDTQTNEDDIDGIIKEYLD